MKSADKSRINRADITDFMIKTLNVGDLREEMEEQKLKKLREITPSGTYLSLYLLLV